jgi:sec-independent protein translocase protein TatA
MGVIMLAELSIGKLLILAVIVLVLFGGKKLRGLGSDLGKSLHDFRKAIKGEGQDADFKDTSAGIEDKEKDKEHQ